MIYMDSGELRRPGFPLFHLQLAAGRRGGCRTERWQNKKPHWQVSPPRPSWALTYASGPRLFFSQTTDTNWQHVSRFTKQTRSPNFGTRSDCRICAGSVYFEMLNTQSKWNWLLWPLLDNQLLSKTFTGTSHRSSVIQQKDSFPVWRRWQTTGPLLCFALMKYFLCTVERLHCLGDPVDPACWLEGSPRQRHGQILTSTQYNNNNYVVARSAKIC